MRTEYTLKGGHHENEIWTWFGHYNDRGYKELWNHKQYASDIYLLMNDENEIVGGYDRERSKRYSVI